MTPALAITYWDADPEFLERVLPLVDAVQVVPDTLAHAHEEAVVLDASSVRRLKDISQQFPILIHGVGLSIGSHDGSSPRYLQMLEALLREVDVAWHSEHLGYTMVDGEFLGTMLTLPRTAEVLDMIEERVGAVRDLFAPSFALENVARLLPEPETEYSEAEFLNELVRRTGCELVLDLHNLECDAHNYGLDIATFLDELDIRKVREVHVSGGILHEGYLLDIHSRRVRDSTVALLRETLSRSMAPSAVTYEVLPEAIPVLGYEAIADDLLRLRRALRR